MSKIEFLLQAASEYARNMQSPFVAWNIDALMAQQNVSTFMIYPARNWTFEGILDGMMEAVTDPDASVMFPVTVPWDKFGWFYPVSIQNILARKFKYEY